MVRTWQRFQRLGQSQEQVISLLGEPDEYPKGNDRFLQYEPGGAFHGGRDGPDWNLVIEFDQSGKAKDAKFVRWVYGPPPG
jgi:hypothetical protein